MKRSANKYIILALTFVLLSVVWAMSGKVAVSKETPPQGETRTITKILRAVSTEIAEGGVGGDPVLDEEDAITLAKMREFWKREDFLDQDEFYFIPFSVPPRKGELEYYPCLECHEDEEINNPTERVLTEEHETIRLNHGGKRYWCPICHFITNMDYLRSMKNMRIDFNRSYLLCGQCHFQRQKDWFIGGHGKRIGNWQGARIILVCTECHNPHSPSIKPKKPDPPPEKHKPPQNIIVQVLKLFGWY